MVTTPRDSRSAADDEIVVYVSQDKQITIIVDRATQAGESAAETSWHAVQTRDRTVAIKFLRSLELSSGKVDNKPGEDIGPKVARARELLRILDSVRADLSGTLTNQDDPQTSRQVLPSLSGNALFAIGCAILGLLLAWRADPLATPLFFAATMAGFAALMTYAATRMLTSAPPQWVRWLNSIRECLANEAPLRMNHP